MIRVDIPPLPYQVHLESLGRLGAITRSCVDSNAKRAHVIADANLPSEIVAQVQGSLASAKFAVSCSRQSASESDKSLQSLEVLLAAIATARLDRFDPVIALGGGIVGDLGGLAAATYRRGVPVIQVPTTLLSMVDASVGGKTAANLSVPGIGLLKNFVGAFWQPRAVLVDANTLTTLPSRDFHAGLAECVKHALISADFLDPSLLGWMIVHADEILARHAGRLRELLDRNISIKAKVVAADPHELAPDSAGGRALLNLGHTFAHSIETIPTLSPTTSLADAPLRHGEAVSLGLVAACHTAASLGLLPTEQVKAVVKLLKTFHLPVKVDGLPPNSELLLRMRHDKKVIDGHVRLVVPVAGCHARVMRDVPADAISSGWDSIRE